MYDRSRARFCRWLQDGENLCFVLLIMIHLLPVWSVRYFPSQDGPAHLNNAAVIREYTHPERSAFREYYLLQKRFDPNLIAHVALAGMMTVLPPLVAEKLLLSGYVILLPVAVRYTMRALQPGAGFLAVLVFPFIYNHHLHMGFYNFLYGLAVFFVVLGYWLRHHERFSLHQTLTLSGLTLVLYICHLVPLLMAYGTIGLLTLWLICLDLGLQLRARKVNWQALVYALRRRVLPVLCAFAPTMILAATYTREHSGGGMSLLPVAYLWTSLAHLTVLISYDERAVWGSTALAGLFAVLATALLVVKVSRHQWSRWDGLLLVVAAYVILYFTMPDAVAGGGYISSRLSLFVYLGLLLWCGVQSYPRVVKWSLQAVASGIALLFLGLHVPKYVALNEYLEEYLSAMAWVTPNTTLLPFVFSPHGTAPDGQLLASRVAPFLHASGHIAAQRGVVDLSNYQAITALFPVKFRPHLHPDTHIWSSRSPDAPPPDFITYAERTGGRVDYVLIWHTDFTEDPRTTFPRQLEPSIRRQLEQGYELIHTSSPRGFMRLYRRTGR